MEDEKKKRVGHKPRSWFSVSFAELNFTHDDMKRFISFWESENKNLLEQVLLSLDSLDLSLRTYELSSNEEKLWAAGEFLEPVCKDIKDKLTKAHIIADKMKNNTPDERGHDPYTLMSELLNSIPQGKVLYLTFAIGNGPKFDVVKIPRGFKDFIYSDLIDYLIHFQSPVLCIKCKTYIPNPNHTQKSAYERDLPVYHSDCFEITRREKDLKRKRRNRQKEVTK